MLPKKAPEKLQNSINLEAKSIATKNRLSDRIEKLAEVPAYVTLKDHKENFRSKPSCRLINLWKNEIGKISKSVSEKIIKKLLTELDFNQWKNTDDVIRWFRNIPNKSESKFIQLHIKEFYPSITEKTLINALPLQRITLQYQKRILGIQNTVGNLFYFTKMKHGRKKTLIPHLILRWRGYDGVELCELVGIYIQSLLMKILSKDNMGL